MNYCHFMGTQSMTGMYKPLPKNNLIEKKCVPDDRMNIRCRPHQQCSSNIYFYEEFVISLFFNINLTVIL